MPFALPAALLHALRARQAGLECQPDPPVRAFGEAFLLYSGLGPELYLIADGRVVVDERVFGEEVREASPDEEVAAIVVGAEKTGIAKLADLLPPPPRSAKSCSRCSGSRWWAVGPNVNGKPFSVVCPDCHGRGWKPAQTA